MSGSLLLPILARGLPNKVHSRSMQCTYLRGLLQIAELARAAPMRGPLIAVVVQHLVSLDVEIRWQDIAFSLGEHLLHTPDPQVCMRHVTLSWERGGDKILDLSPQCQWHGL